MTEQNEKQKTPNTIAVGLIVAVIPIIFQTVWIIPSIQEKISGAELLAQEKFNNMAFLLEAYHRKVERNQNDIQLLREQFQYFKAREHDHEPRGRR